MVGAGELGFGGSLWLPPQEWPLESGCRHSPSDKATRQRIPGSHTPPCHRRMVITTQFSVLPCCTVAQRRPVLYHSRWFLMVLWPWPSLHLGQLAPTTLPQCRLVSNPSSDGAMRQRILGSHTPPCPRRMVITDVRQGGGGG